MTGRRPSRTLRARRRHARWLVAALVALAAAGTLAGVALAVLVSTLRASLPDLVTLYQPPSQATRVYAANGELIASLYRENRAYVRLSEIPRVLQQAVVAIEDERFYQHRGVDPRAILRAAWRNLTRQAVVEGGSTITQQLARNLFLSSRRTLDRKLQEMLLAVEIERRLTKDEILERYLNQVYFGNGAYGVEMASRLFFGKSVREVTLPEAALLAGVIQAPARYSPFENFEAAKRRQEVVLDRMVELGYVSRQQAEEAKKVPLRLTSGPRNLGLVGVRAPYFVSYLLPYLVERYGEEAVYNGGLRVYTTLDTRLQALAQEVVARGVEEARRAGLRVTQGALVAIEPGSGRILAMVGGVDFQRSQFNRAWQARRQPGSAFKPFVYTAALEHGVSPERVLLDSPVEYRIAGWGYWKPKNYDGTYWGPVSLRVALEQSRNVPAVRMLAELGPQAVIDTARRMGIRSPLQPNLSLALGTSEVTPLEMAAAFATLAAGGVYAEPVAITKVTDARGRVLEEVRPQRRLALRPEVAYLMTDLLRGVILRGTGRAADPGRPAAGKTGTTDDYRNAWFVGYTPELAVAVWVGNDDNSPTNRVVGGSVPARLWARFVKRALAGRPPAEFPVPEGVVHVRVCVREAPDGGCERYGWRPFLREALASPQPGPSAPAPAEPPASKVPPVVLVQPADGSEVTSPFVVEGRGTPGSQVRLVVVMEGGPAPVTVVDAQLPVGADGSFGYTVESALRFSGARYRITVEAVPPDGSGGRAEVVVRER